MKILVFSDSHDVITHMLEAVEAEKPDMVLHLGDHDYDCKDIARMYPDITIRAVRGNCDRGSQELDADEFVIDGVRFFMTHGHLFGVKMGLGQLRDSAGARGVNIALFGHTHYPLCETWIDGITYLNPGSIGSGKGSYATITIKDGKAECQLNRSIER